MDEKVRDLCDTVLDYMDELSPIVVKLYEEIKDYNLNNITVLGDVSQGLNWLLNAAKILKQELKLNIDDEINSISSQLKEIMLSLENFDYLYLSDILEFDVIPNMEKIFNIVRNV